MTPSTLVIVTDRGSLKAYRVNETPTRGPSLQLEQAFSMTDAHGRLIDKVSDLAGRFPVTEGAGAHRGPASIAERTQLATETDRRIQKELADQIAKIVSQNGNDGWSFAAPAEIHTAIVDLLPAGVRQRIVEHVKSDLVKVAPRHELVADERQMDNGTHEPLKKVIHDAFKTMERELRRVVEKQRRDIKTHANMRSPK